MNFKNQIMNKKKLILNLVMAFVLTIVLTSSRFTSFSETVIETPFTLELQESNGELSDSVEVSFPEYQLQGTHLGIKLYTEHAIDQNGQVPAAGSMFHITLYDVAGNTYSTNQPSHFTYATPDSLPAFSDTGAFVNTIWGYSHMWPKLGFYGTIYLPLDRLDSSGLKEDLTINKIRIQHNSKSNSRQEMITHFFELEDATITLPTQEEVWMGDVLILEDFDMIRSENCVMRHGQVLDFSKVDVTSEDVKLSDNAKMFARRMTETEYTALMEKDNSGADVLNWQANYGVSGQKFSYTPFDNGNYGKGLNWQYGSYLIDYDSALNSYGSLSIKASTANWLNAKGLTVWCKNPQNYPVSFNLEFAESENGGAERWNLNSNYYRKIYAYNTVTGEEFAFHNLTVCWLPAKFEGWIRIPFAEYEVPSWSAAYSWSDSVLDLRKPHPSLWITSQFIVNDGVTMYFDNIGLYYADFQVGKLFDRTKLSIKECLALTNYENEVNRK